MCVRKIKLYILKEILNIFLITKLIYFEGLINHQHLKNIA